MEITLVNDYQFAPNLTSLSSKLFWGQRPKSRNLYFWSKIRIMTNLLLSRLRWKNAIVIWYLNENELIWDFRGHTGLKQTQNLKFDFKSAWAKSTNSCLKLSVDYICGQIFKKWTHSEFLQNSTYSKCFFKSNQPVIFSENKGKLHFRFGKITL